MKYEYYFRITSSNALKNLKEDFKKKTKVVQTNHHHLLKNQKCSSKSIAQNWQCYRKSYKEKDVCIKSRTKIKSQTSGSF